MPDNLLSSQDAARQLGVSTTTLYDWLAQSNKSTLLIRGQPVAIDYLQGGPNGQGRVKIENREVDRIKDLMRVRPCPAILRRPPIRQKCYPGITVKLGRPGD